MGLGKDLIKIGVAGLVANKVAKNFVQEQKKQERCTNCGSVGEAHAVCTSTSIWTGGCEKSLCKNCANKCKECKRFFCLKHIDNHNCK